LLLRAGGDVGRPRVDLRHLGDDPVERFASLAPAPDARLDVDAGGRGQRSDLGFAFERTRARPSDVDGDLERADDRGLG